MSFIDSLTPKDTEEVRPGLFIQKTSKGYRQIYPAAWNGKINYNNFFFGSGFLKSFIWFAILMIIIFGYYDSTKSCNEFQSDPCKYLPNITTYCIEEETDYNILYNEKEVKPRVHPNPLQGYP